MKFTTVTALLFATLTLANPLGTPTKRDPVPCVPDDPLSCTNIGAVKREPEPEPKPEAKACVVDDPTSGC
ncbi:uncharacterized protein BKCO1_8300016 [Diplodia corticola]|uniref:Uncharacterized protein n=1 Tax=Diplodia corticola TaxID=236234 RepID=A0A1J9RLH1_9PEZI|nr:uncharacterized protein BKCO1_8300016 [Diplodia corticola]OJD29359.1 hypothetical protein BKCO1_8300016 [Diplodia corticola]